MWLFPSFSFMSLSNSFEYPDHLLTFITFFLQIPTRVLLFILLRIFSSRSHYQSTSSQFVFDSSSPPISFSYPDSLLHLAIFLALIWSSRRPFCCTLVTSTFSWSFSLQIFMHIQLTCAVIFNLLYIIFSSLLTSSWYDFMVLWGIRTRLARLPPHPFT